MKNIFKFIIVSLIILILKVVGGIFLHSNTLLSSSIFELSLITNSLLTTSKENNSSKKIISIIYAIILIAGLVFLNYLSITNENLTPSLLIIIILVISMILRYMSLVFNINKTVNKKQGILALANITSNKDFLLFVIILASIIISKIGKWFDFLKYADKAGCIAISLLLTYQLVKIIINTFKEPSNFIDEYTKEINARSEINSIKNFQLTSFGGVRKISISIIPKDNISMIDLTSFILNLNDYLLKKAEVASVELGEYSAYRKVMLNARNSGSRNGKTNSQKKNSKKKNKKR